MQFNKTAKTTSELCLHYSQKGLTISPDSAMMDLLADIGFYRLKGYMPPFFSNANKQFFPDTDISKILDLYFFDKKLRAILMNSIEFIEVATRTRICNTMAEIYGSHWYLDSNHFDNQGLYANMIQYISEYVQHAYEPFIQNYLRKYTSPSLPPSWMISDILTFGKMSSMYENLKDNQIKKQVANRFGTLPVFLESWLKSINFIRNLCAHHGRLWNRRLPLKPKLPTRAKHQFLQTVTEETNQKLYGILSCMIYMGQFLPGQFSLKADILSLIADYPQISLSAMGFPAHWRSEPLWA